MAKNIADFFGEKKQNKAKCKNILDYDFVNDIASNISPEKLSDDEKIEQRPNSSSNKKSQFIRKYDESFIKYGFSFITQNGIEKPMCVVCGETLANSSMAPAKMQRHLETQQNLKFIMPFVTSYLSHLLAELTIKINDSLNQRNFQRL